MQTLPLVPSLPNYRFGTALDGVQYIFDFRWNSRDEAWYMAISSEDGTLIRTGIKVVLGIALGGRVADSDFPTGAFFALDLSNAGVEATLDDLGERVAVVYQS